jgi:hypothetical protein
VVAISGGRGLGAGEEWVAYVIVLVHLWAGHAGSTSRNARKLSAYHISLMFEMFCKALFWDILNTGTFPCLQSYKNIYCCIFLRRLNCLARLGRDIEYCTLLMYAKL